MRTLGRKIALVAVAFATVGSTIFGGAALANEDPNDVDVYNTGGAGGNGGNATANCLIPIGVSVGLQGYGGDVHQCNAQGGDGGTGGAGVAVGDDGGNGDAGAAPAATEPVAAEPAAAAPAATEPAATQPGS